MKTALIIFCSLSLLDIYINGERRPYIRTIFGVVALVLACLM